MPTDYKQLFAIQSKLEEQNTRLVQENQQLKEQLAEKEKELAEYADINNTLNSGLQEKCILCEEEHNQDKTSFAIEQLKKVKEKILSYEEIYYQFLENGAKIPMFCVENFRVIQNIDNQINAIKEMK